MSNTVTALAADVARIERDAQHKAEAARAKAAKATEAAAVVQQAAEQAAEIERAARGELSSRYLNEMRRLTEQVHQARAAAVEAVRTGRQPVEAWLAYRRTRAENHAETFAQFLTGVVAEQEREIQESALHATMAAVLSGRA
jgi:hypothetical protein